MAQHVKSSSNIEFAYGHVSGVKLKGRKPRKIKKLMALTTFLESDFKGVIYDSKEASCSERPPGFQVESTRVGVNANGLVNFDRFRQEGTSC